MDANGQRYLVKQLDLARTLPRLADSSRAQDRLLLTFEGAIKAFHAVELMNEEEARDWSDRMFAALGREPTPPATLGSSVGKVPPTMRSSAQRPLTPFPASLSRIVPASDAIIPLQFGMRFQVVSIELYDTKVTVNWYLGPLPDVETQFATELADHDRDTEGLPEAERVASRQRLAAQLHGRQHVRPGLADDLGTDYLSLTGGGSGNGHAWRGYAEFIPSVPDGARTVSVQVGADSCSVPMS